MSHVASLGLKKYYFNLNCMKVHENWSVKRLKSSYFRCHTSGNNQSRQWEWEKTTPRGDNGDKSEEKEGDSERRDDVM